jgi:predicted permease
MPVGFENLLAPSAQVWTTLQYEKSLLPQSREWGHHLSMVGRLRAGVGREQARQELNEIARKPVAEFVRPPYADLSQGLLVNSLRDDVASEVRPALLSVLGAVMLVLLIACVNVTNLLLARGAQRRGEFAMRAALGAARQRLIRQQLTESLLLAVVGGALGLLLAQFVIGALVSLRPPGLPRAGATGVDATAFVFAFGMTTLVGLMVGLIPALQTTRSDLHHVMQQSSWRITGSHQLTRRTLVVAELALALVLLVSVGLLLRSLERLFSIHPGFQTEHLLTMQVQTAGLDAGATHHFFARSLEAVREVPGVSAAAFTSQLPLSGELREGYGVHFESSPTGNPEADNGGLRYAVTPGYFETMGIPLRRGRLLTADDKAGAPLAVVISESLAKSKFPGQDPLGQRLRIGPNDSPWFTIVGVVGDVKQASLAASLTDAVYMTTEQWSLFADKALWLVVRTRADAAQLAPAIKSAIWSVDKNQPIVHVAAMDELLAASAGERRFALILFEAFGLLALVLAAVGIYGVLSGSVTERTREIGVRLALGATRGDILRLVMRQGLLLTLLGIGLGLCGAVVASRAITSLLFGVSRLDPVSYLGVVVLLTIVSAVACLIPAWRAARVDPSITLKAE